MLAAEYPDVRFIQSQQNRGFAKANNAAARIASGRTLLFLNPDTEVVGSAIDVMFFAVTTHANVGVVGPKLLNGDGTVQTSCVQSIPTIANQLLNSQFLRERWPRASLWGMAPLYEDSGALAPVEGISGACAMISAEAFEGVHGFSEDYFMYAEDMDLCHKVRTGGCVNYFVNEATVIHYGGGSSAKEASTFGAVMMTEAIWRFLAKTRGSLYGFAYRATMLVSALLRLGTLQIAMILNFEARQRWLPSRRKWLAVLRWTVGCDGIVKQYY
jgi:GT2 family glycosyltransferase